MAQYVVIPPSFQRPLPPIQHYGSAHSGGSSVHLSFKCPTSLRWFWCNRAVIIHSWLWRSMINMIASSENSPSSISQSDTLPPFFCFPLLQWYWRPILQWHSQINLIGFSLLKKLVIFSNFSTFSFFLLATPLVLYIVPSWTGTNLPDSISTLTQLQLYPPSSSRCTSLSCSPRP